jgi:hypothetical protein
MDPKERGKYSDITLTPNAVVPAFMNILTSGTKVSVWYTRLYHQKIKTYTILTH